MMAAIEKKISRIAIYLLPAVILVSPLVPAHASGLSILLPNVAAFVVTANSQCVTYAYDENGNRTAISVAAIATSATQWGSGSYGCFVWHS